MVQGILKLSTCVPNTGNKTLNIRTDWPSTVKIHYLENLSSNNVKTDDFANVIQNPPAIPSTLKTKSDVIAWRESEHTKHVFFSPYEGMMAGSRVTQRGQQNPAIILHGFVADYDQKLSSDQQMLDSIALNQAPDYPPSYAVRSFSGHAHVVWEFENPIRIVNEKMLDGFLQTFCSRAKVGKLLGGFDDMSLRPSLYYTLYSNWHTLSAPVPENMLHYILYHVGTSIKPYEQEGPTIPWSVIEEEMTSRWPGTWTGKIEDGARGLRFWDPTATHPSGAMLTQTGVAYFTDGGGFLPWGSPFLLGPTFVRQFEANRVGEAVKDIYYDGASYYRKNNGDWQKDNHTIIQNHLAVVGGLSTKQAKGRGVTEVAEAVEHITSNNRVAGQMPFVYCKDPIVKRKGKLFINSSTARCHGMSDTPVTWGQGFPFIADWIDNFFYSPFQKVLWISWLHHFYKNSFDGTPRAGQCMFVAGGSNKGKTLMNHRLLGGMMGGHSDIASYVTGDDNFNENLFEVGLGTVDDQLASSDRRSHLRYTALLKKLVANNVLSMRAMFKGSVDIDWCGRLSVTMNEDPESMRMLPDLDINNRDKVVILRCSPQPINFLADVERTIQQELTYFCRYIYDFCIPKECAGSPRFGVKSYIDPHLRGESDYSSVTYATVEMLDEWRESYFTAFPDKTEWYGSITKLVSELSTEFGENAEIRRNLSPASLIRQLTTAMNRHSWIKRDTRNGRPGFVIERGDASFGGGGEPTYEDEPIIEDGDEFDPLTLSV